MADMMMFPDTVEEFMEEYKMVDRDEVYSNGTEYVPIYRMEQWFEHEREKCGTWEAEHSGGFTPGGNPVRHCSKCGWVFGAHMIYPDYRFCPMCGIRMKEPRL